MYTRIKYTRASLLKIRDTTEIAQPANIEEINSILNVRLSDKKRTVKKVETDVTGFQSVRRVSKKDADTPSPVDAPVFQEGMDDIQVFRAQMKAKEVSVNGAQQIFQAAPIQSTNIFDILEKLESAQFEGATKSKFNKLFEESTQDAEKIEELSKLAKSLKVSNEPEEDNPLSALLNSSIKGKKNK